MLVRHMNTHSPARHFPCTIQGCKFRAKTQGALRAHKSTHNKEATLPCTFPGCAYLGRNRLMLKAHVRRHETYPNLQACPQPGCNHFAKDSMSLQKHRPVHSNIKRPFACPLCPKFFPQKGDLDVHSFSHTKEKYLKCMHCDYGTYRPHSLTQHYEKTHPGNSCNSCWLKPIVMTCKYCTFSGTSDAILKHKATEHTTLIVSLEKIRIKLL